MTLIFGFLLLFFLSPIIVIGDGDGKWGYRSGNYVRPGDWKDVYRACRGNRQSPINIDTRASIYWSELKPVNINTQQDRPGVLLKKSDTTLYLNFLPRWIINFNDNTCLRPMAIHWHWGSTSVQGSEHNFNNEKYPIEGHMVTYNCNLYNNSENASTSPSGLHVFGILYKIGVANPVLAEMLSSLINVSATIPEIFPRRILPDDIGKYYRYEGSLTTPPCTENVVWTVFSEVLTISEDQMNQFRSLMYGKPESGNMVDNFRPLISLTPSSEYMKRVVYSSFNNGRRVLGSLYTFILTLTLIQMIFVQGP